MVPINGSNDIGRQIGHGSIHGCNTNKSGEETNNPSDETLTVPAEDTGVDHLLETYLNYGHGITH